jgi:hypothetical protein
MKEGDQPPLFGLPPPVKPAKLNVASAKLKVLQVLRKLRFALVVALIVVTGLLGYYMFSPLIWGGTPQTIISSNWIEDERVHQVSLLEGYYYFLTLDAKDETSPEQVSVKVCESGTSEVLLDKVYEREYSPGHVGTLSSTPPNWYYTGEDEFSCVKTEEYEVFTCPAGEGPYSIHLAQSGEGTAVWYSDIPIFAYLWFVFIAFVPLLVMSRISKTGLLPKSEQRLVYVLSAEGGIFFILSIVLMILLY